MIAKAGGDAKELSESANRQMLMMQPLQPTLQEVSMLAVWSEVLRQCVCR